MTDPARPSDDSSEPGASPSRAEPGDDDVGAAAEFLDELTALESFLQREDDLSGRLAELSHTVAATLDARNCSIMLIKEGGGDTESESEGARLRLLAHDGYLPDEAYRDEPPLTSGIAGEVARTGRPLLVADIEKSSLGRYTRRDPRKGSGFLSVPITLDGRVIGVINLSGRSEERPFAGRDLELATVLALYIGKCIQVLRLKGLLHSNLAQTALALEQHDDTSDSPLTEDPARVARLLAKTFFREMKGLGLGPDHILNAATEIISQLHGTLDKHRERLGPEEH